MSPAAAAGGPPSRSPDIELVVPSQRAGERLDVALGGEPEVGSRASAQRLIEAGRVLVDGRARPKRHLLAGGELVQVQLERPEPARAHARPGIDLAIAYEDEHLLVVDKPAGMVVHPAPGHPTGTLVQALVGRAAGGADAWRPGIVHRLDRDTSGLLVVAKSEHVHRALQALIRERAVEREYIALVEGVPEARTATIEAPIGRDRARRTLVSTRTDRPRSARTHFELLEVVGRRSLLELRLETGRTHQIRAHLAAIGHPVCGDVAYGGGAAGEALGLSRQFLHSARLAFSHPESGARVEARAPLPADLATALDRARAAAP